MKGKAPSQLSKFVSITQCLICYNGTSDKGSVPTYDVRITNHKGFLLCHLYMSEWERRKT